MLNQSVLISAAFLLRLICTLLLAAPSLASHTRLAVYRGLHASAASFPFPLALQERLPFPIFEKKRNKITMLTIVGLLTAMEPFLSTEGRRKERREENHSSILVSNHPEPKAFIHGRTDTFDFDLSQTIPPHAL